MLGFALIVFNDYRESADLADLLGYLLKNKISPIITTPDKLKETFLVIKKALFNTRMPILFYKNAHIRIDLPVQVLSMLLNTKEYNAVINSENKFAAFIPSYTEIKDTLDLDNPFIINQPFRTNIRIEENKEGYLVYDGERVVPNAPAAYENMQLHLSFYKVLLPHTHNAIVADIACGCGYGTYEISKIAKQVIGFDIDSKAVDFASRYYHKDNLSFKTGISRDLQKNYFDVVTSVETFEHIEIEDLKVFIKDIYEALKENGTWIFTTPNGDVLKYNPKRKEDRIGHHIKHYTKIELKEMLSCFRKFEFIKEDNVVYIISCTK